MVIGLKAEKANLSTANALRTMGHSVVLHEQTFHETISKEDTKEIVRRKLLEEKTL